MIKVIATLTIFGSLVFLGLGGIFVIAGGSENVMIGAASIGIGLLLLLVAYILVRMEARRPVNQNITVQMGGSGEFREKSIQCPGCGGSVKEENVKLIEGGIMVSCPYCGKVSALEEEPKW